jgi:hypothetical protein
MSSRALFLSPAITRQTLGSQSRAGYYTLVCEDGVSYSHSKNNALVTAAVFILCWSPYFVFDLLQVYGKVPETQTNIAVATFIQSLAPLNSAANPMIYCLFSTRMCNTVRYVPVTDSADCTDIAIHEQNPS